MKRRKTLLFVSLISMCSILGTILFAGGMLGSTGAFALNRSGETEGVWHAYHFVMATETRHGSKTFYANSIDGCRTYTLEDPGVECIWHFDFETYDAFINMSPDDERYVPPVTKYSINYSSSYDYKIVGIDSRGYYEGELVCFQVININPDFREVTQVRYDDTTITPSGGYYSFTMPAKDVTIYVVVKNKESLAVSWSGDLVVGHTVTFSITIDMTPATNPWIEGDPTKVEINGTNVTFLAPGEVSLIFHGTGSSGQELSYEIWIYIEE